MHLIWWSVLLLAMVDWYNCLPACGMCISRSLKATEFQQGIYADNGYPGKWPLEIPSEPPHSPPTAVFGSPSASSLHPVASRLNLSSRPQAPLRFMMNSVST